jgi:hypothetical protein
MRVRLNSEVVGREIEVGRVIGHFNGAKGPTVVITAGVHGNEPLGVYALKNVVEYIEKHKLQISGNFYAFAGNLAALDKGVRFIQQDLNRIWKVSLVEKLESGNIEEELSPDMREMVDLHKRFKAILKSNKGPFHFIDLHTTSSPTVPFIPVNDTLINRKFTAKFPIPSVLGIEEFLGGALLSYVNEFKAVGLGFEAGQHEDPDSVFFHEGMCWLTLVFAGCLRTEDVPNFDRYYDGFLEKTSEMAEFFEVRRRYLITEGENFRMNEGYESFQSIRAGELLAHNDEGDIRAIETGRIFMPLYQKQGREGFYIVRKVEPVWLRMSTFLRKIQLDNFLSWLPGVRKHPKYSHTLIVNTKVASYLATDLFHLLGYRRKRKTGEVIYFTRREL